MMVPSEGVNEAHERPWYGFNRFGRDVHVEKYGDDGVGGGPGRCPRLFTELSRNELQNGPVCRYWFITRLAFFSIFFRLSFRPF